jgi:CheY-like chemotaxis protein
VLVVDDDAQIRALVRAVLDGVAEVTECSDGVWALQAFEQHRPDWVLMDVRMPVVGGMTATRGILAAHPDARIVILTQHDSAALRRAAAEAGAVSYVLKDDLTLLRQLVVPL